LFVLVVTRKFRPCLFFAINVVSRFEDHTPTLRALTLGWLLQQGLPQLVSSIRSLAVMPDAEDADIATRAEDSGTYALPALTATGIGTMPATIAVV
jgi:hypothetical protein